MASGSSGAGTPAAPVAPAPAPSPVAEAERALPAPVADSVAGETETRLPRTGSVAAALVAAGLLVLILGAALKLAGARRLAVV